MTIARPTATTGATALVDSGCQLNIHDLSPTLLKPTMATRIWHSLCTPASLRRDTPFDHVYCLCHHQGCGRFSRVSNPHDRLSISACIAMFNHSFTTHPHENPLRQDRRRFQPSTLTPFLSFLDTLTGLECRGIATLRTRLEFREYKYRLLSYNLKTHSPPSLSSFSSHHQQHPAP